MDARSRLVGRSEEVDRLLHVLERARVGEGSLLLLAGEAGVGKTRLVEEVGETSGALVLRGVARHGVATPYAPVAGALRSRLRSSPDALAGVGRLRSHLALLLPELGEPAATSDASTLLEAMGCALATIAADRRLLLFLDDLQWSDEATIELLSGLAEPLAELPVAVVAAYRSDGLPRDHGLRRLRNELRRAGRLAELTVEPLDREGTRELLGQVLEAPASPGLTRVVEDRTQGVPFFVEELARALKVAGALERGSRGLELPRRGEVPVPDTIRDAVLIGMSELSVDARAAAEAAAVAGECFDLELVASVAGDKGLGELVEAGLLVEQRPGQASFRHSLTREAIYADVPWLRRRGLHRTLAAALVDARAPSMQIATQWIGARDSDRARDALVRAAAEFERLHAYRDAARAGRQALELSADSDQEAGRLEVLERYARCAELAGDLAEAVRAWREVSDLCAARGEVLPFAEAQRRLAGAHDLKGDRARAFAAREAAADAYSRSGLPAEAAVDHLAMANHLRLTGRHAAAVDLAQTARAEATAAADRDLGLRAQGLEGVAVAKAGGFERGLEIVREALAVAVEHELTAVAAELYQRLSLVLYDAADYRRAQEALDAALELCRASGDSGTELACVSCMAYVLRDRGEWARAAEICREMLAYGSAVFVAEGMLGSIHAFQGRLSSARRLLTSSLEVSSRLGHYNMTVDSSAALASVAAAEGAHDEAAELCHAILGRWEESDDNHYALSGLRWAATFLARRDDRAGLHACTQSLTRIAARAAHAEAVAALAHAIAETALLDGDPDTAVEHLRRALELHQTIDMPFVRAQIELRCGVALAAAGDREAAVDRLAGAYRAARRLGARPLAAEAAREVAALGESVVRRSGERGAAAAAAGGLSRREAEVVRRLAVGRTNREIADELFLSPRTVDMHVRNILRKLDCRSRVEAANRAAEMQLLT